MKPHITFRNLFLSIAFFFLAYTEGGCSQIVKTHFSVIHNRPKQVIDYTNETALAWNRLFFDICRNTDGYRVTVAVRALAYINWAAYEAVAPAMTKYQSVAAQKGIENLPNIDKNLSYHWALAVNTAYYKSILYHFPKINNEMKQRVEDLAEKFETEYAAECDEETFERSKNIGETAVKAIIAFCAFDNGAFGYLENKPFGYHLTIPTGEGLWEQTYPDYLYALTPYWGKVRPVLADTQKIAFVSPIKYSTDKNSEFYKQAYEVYRATSQVTAENCWISQFWSDDIQFFTFDTGSRFVSIACQLIENKNVDLENSLYILSKLSIGLFDGGIVCWKEKYMYNVVRPSTYIRNNIEAEWVTNLNDLRKGGFRSMGITPAHPSYPSGHSVFGAVAKTVLEDYFGKNCAFTDNSHKDRNDFWGSTPRSFKNLEEMMLENAYSRIPLGVHYRMDCDEGLRIGQLIGQQLNNVHWEKKQN